MFPQLPASEVQANIDDRANRAGFLTSTAGPCCWPRTETRTGAARPCMTGS